MSSEEVPFVISFSFSATGVSPAVPLFGIFTLTIWGTPLNGDGTPGAFSGTIRVERSQDGGTTWLPVSTDGSGTPATYTSSIAVQGAEYSFGAHYRFNCTAYTSGTISCSLAAAGWFRGRFP